MSLALESRNLIFYRLFTAIINLLNINNTTNVLLLLHVLLLLYISNVLLITFTSSAKWI